MVIYFIIDVGIINYIINELIQFIFYKALFLIYKLNSSSKNKISCILHCIYLVLFSCSFFNNRIRAPPFFSEPKKRKEKNMKNDFKRFDFRIQKDNSKIEYYIRIDHIWVQISKEVYSLYRNSYRKINRDNKRDKGLCHFDDIELAALHSIETNEMNILDSIHVRELFQKLHKVIERLSVDEQKIIYEIYFKDKTEREVASILNISNSTLHYQKIKILKKIKQSLEQDSF